MGLVNRIVQSFEVTHEPNLTIAQQLVANDDLLPVEPAKRTWRAYNYIAFWTADTFNINMWMIVSSMIQLGMSWWQAWICVWLGYGIAAPFLVLNARPGAIFHVMFPIVNRTSFGMFGSLWCVFNRAAMACIWYGVQASIGGSCVLVMLRAMWPSIYDLANSMPASSGTNTRDYLCFFLFWLISLPIIWFPVHKVRHFFLVTPILMPIASITFLIWCIVKAHGIGPIIHQPSTLHGSKLGWAMVVSSMSCISNEVTLVTNAPDFASRARTPSAALHSQLFAIPLSAAFVSLIGILVSSSSQAIYGTAIWSPIDLLGNFLNDNPSKATRFGVWFISASFMLAQVTTNICANSVSAGCDLTALFPRFINIRRGGYIAATVGLAMCPWNLLKNSDEFTSYLSAYSVFLSSIAGVMVTEYYFVRKGHYNVGDLYNTERGSWYWYTYGINFRAYTAYISGILINVVGFAGATGRTVPLAATRIYELSFFTGFGVSAIVYWTLNRVFPVIGAADTFEEIDVSGYELTARGLRDVEEVDMDTKDGGSDHSADKELAERKSAPNAGKKMMS
ncbi:permease for cytosine/purines, uracil, thiamine, allantoin-domain-containing protein [Suillus subaureus]|uniref:Permease for cytosine/purines, uracil, thiamine, allantoin-domain-containing protein n=1 Tax=Suillus subaureus TaxID=48587 RepID=A0A9P7ALE3_9AGAM|nr:permease for cytosine/purines, uracil, thiamine, allantoin-domain-containing protein [Suillus subaureus]KAG1791783.1 permease for cytosine/purines, uracil, thiamine, allantoin-domain-containing protein [Suillus subaureus]